MRRGFTLIELSIVLVIIGLVAGGILVGRDMIKGAEIRAQITQIDKYRTAANVFRDKYGGLPGDLGATSAARFGFIARGQYRGEGDGNGVLEGIYADNSYSYCGYCEGTGETAVFWVDLTTAKLIDGSFTAAIENGPAIGLNNVYPPGFEPYFPKAVIGSGNYIFVWSGGIALDYNYFDLSVPVFVSGGLAASPGLSENAAQNIDSKIDDGNPLTGRVIAAGPSHGNGAFIGASDNSATPGSTTTCYDNGGVAGAIQHYSTEQNSGDTLNCELSFRL